jgi:hypothetical protein
MVAAARLDSAARKRSVRRMVGSRKLSPCVSHNRQAGIQDWISSCVSPDIRNDRNGKNRQHRAPVLRCNENCNHLRHENVGYQTAGSIGWRKTFDRNTTTCDSDALCSAARAATCFASSNIGRRAHTAIGRTASAGKNGSGSTAIDSGPAWAASGKQACDTAAGANTGDPTDSDASNPGCEAGTAGQQ